jgi:hypothetical protein
MLGVLASGRTADVIAAVQQAVDRMEGVGWFDVEARFYPAACHGGVIVYPRGHCITPDSPQWRELRHEVESVATAAMVAAAAPFWPVARANRAIGRAQTRAHWPCLPVTTKRRGDQIAIVCNDSVSMADRIMVLVIRYR